MSIKNSRWNKMEKQDLIKKIQEDYLKYAESGNIFELNLN